MLLLKVIYCQDALKFCFLVLKSKNVVEVDKMLQIWCLLRLMRGSATGILDSPQSKLDICDKSQLSCFSQWKIFG